MSAQHPTQTPPTQTPPTQTPPTQTPPTQTPPAPARRVGPRIIAVIGAAAAAAAVWSVAGPLAGVRLLVRTSASAPARPLALATVIAVSLLAGLIAWALLVLLDRGARRPRRTWTIIAAAALVVSLAGPLTDGHGAASVAWLVAMHLAVGLVLIPVLRQTAAVRRG